MDRPAFKENVPLSKYSTYGIGGCAQFFLEITTSQEMREVLSYLNMTKERVLILGKGSNLLFDDRGFKGYVLLNKIQTIEWNEQDVHAGAGYSFSLLGIQASKRGLSGLEFASGIPGSVGGAVYMNAGAGGQETASVLKEVQFVHMDGRLEIIPREKIQFAYRTSFFQNEKKGAIVQVSFSLIPHEGAKKEQERLLEYRMSTQPYKAKSCGCMFQNPEKHFAGQLIEQAGLKGFKIGGARVSTEHANFLINEGEASSKDILALADHIEKTIFDKHQIKLKKEVCIIPYE